MRFDLSRTGLAWPASGTSDCRSATTIGPAPAAVCDGPPSLGSLSPRLSTRWRSSCDHIAVRYGAVIELRATSVMRSACDHPSDKLKTLPTKFYSAQSVDKAGGVAV